MKASEVRVLDDGALADAIENALKELYKLRFQEAAGRLANNSRLRIVRRDLARMLTVRRERELDAAHAVKEGK